MTILSRRSEVHLGVGTAFRVAVGGSLNIERSPAVMASDRRDGVGE